MPPPPGCPSRGTPSPEVTGSICLVPSTPFSRAPWYTLPIHLCRFRVRSICWGCFLDELAPPGQSSKPEQHASVVTSSGPRNVDLVPIGYGSRPRLRGRLTLRGLTLRRNPWMFGGSGSRTPCVTHVSILASVRSRTPHGYPFAAERNAPLPLALACKPAASVGGLSPGTSSAQAGLSRPVSYYAFFKGWLLLSQPPGCLGLPTSFPT